MPTRFIITGRPLPLIMLALIAMPLFMYSPSLSNAGASSAQDANATPPRKKLSSPQKKPKSARKKTSPPQQQPDPEATPEAEPTFSVVYVSSVAQLIQAIRPNVEIKLSQGVYTLANKPVGDTPYVRWRKLPDDTFEPVISTVYNLTITGEPGTKILIDSDMATVLSFEDSQNIRIQNVIMGHSGEPGYCMGEVLSFNNVSGVEIRDSLLFGSGTYGLFLRRTEHMSFVNSTIQGCSVGIALIRDSGMIRFERSTFKENSYSDLIEIVKSNDITFTHCQFENNSTDSSKYFLFNIDEDSKNVVLSNSKVTSNKISQFINVEGRLTTSGNIFAHNGFKR